jgi:hypothetical protein
LLYDHIIEANSTFPKRVGGFEEGAIFHLVVSRKDLDELAGDSIGGKGDEEAELSQIYPENFHPKIHSLRDDSEECSVASNRADGVASLKESLGQRVIFGAPHVHTSLATELHELFTDFSGSWLLAIND